MSGTLRTLLGARAAAVVGRQAERAVLLELAERDRPLVVAVYGIAGIGKSALLRREGLSDADAARVTRFTHGHPLALRLAASARGARPDLTIPDAAVATVVTELARVYLPASTSRPGPCSTPPARCAGRPCRF